MSIKRAKDRERKVIRNRESGIIVLRIMSMKMRKSGQGNPMDLPVTTRKQEGLVNYSFTACLSWF